MRLTREQLQFQSAPGCYPGRNGRSTSRRLSASSFQSAPGCYPGRNPARPAKSAPRPEFQSAPGCYPGRNSLRIDELREVIGFNPLPGVTPGETRQQGRTVGGGCVSIRSRVLPREKRADGAGGMICGYAFQSAPGCYPGRNRYCPALHLR